MEITEQTLQSLQSELSTLDHLIAITPPEDVIDLSSLQDRKAQVLEYIKCVEQELFQHGKNNIETTESDECIYKGDFIIGTDFIGKTPEGWTDLKGNPYKGKKTDLGKW